MKNKIIITILIVFSFSCNRVSNRDDLKKIENMNWLIGTWSNISDDGKLSEVWAKTSDTVFSGKSFKIFQDDTVFSERISLELLRGGLFYIPVVHNQNNGLPVAFKLISNSGAEFIFENKEHDFPQRIIYKNTGKDSLYASVEGNDDGTFRKEEFYLTKEKR
ncbi:MAG: hypothetical protein JJE25_08820 [Bacteroidia bacterium]|nr:hypothetical protein [Bacteroidia bacterium]